MISERRYQLSPIEALQPGPSVAVRTIFESEVVRGPRPIFFWDGEGLCDLSGYLGEQIAPEVRIIELADVKLIGRTEFILKNRTAYYPQPLDPIDYAFMVELEGRGSVDGNRRHLRIMARRKVIRVDRAVSLLGQCNSNYAHWLLEALPRLMVFDSMPHCHGLPLLVDHPIHEKLRDALDILNEGGREIITVRPYQMVQARTLFYVTLPSITPPETRRFFDSGTLAEPKMDQFRFSREALCKLRSVASRVAPQYELFPKEIGALRLHRKRSGYVRRRVQSGRVALPKLIYLRRSARSTGHGRLLVNGDSVEILLENRGFVTMDMADLAFAEQAQALKNAEIVVSPMGAALTNLVFCPPGCQVIILSPLYPNASYHYFANLLTALGHRAIFVLGEQVSYDIAPKYNKNFRVKLSLLEKALADLEGIR